MQFYIFWRGFERHKKTILGLTQNRFDFYDTGEIRTLDLRFRRPLLYPAELLCQQRLLLYEETALDVNQIFDGKVTFLCYSRGIHRSFKISYGTKI